MQPPFRRYGNIDPLLIAHLRARIHDCLGRQRRHAFRISLSMGLLGCGGIEKLEGRIFAEAVGDPTLAGLVFPSRLSTIAGMRESARREKHGLSEEVGAARVEYYGERGESSEPVDIESVVISVRVTWTPQSDTLASVAWHERSRAVHAVLNVAPQCFLWHGEPQSSRLAVWPHGRGSVYVIQRSANNSDKRPPSLDVAWTLDSTHLRPLYASSRQTACEAALSAPVRQ